LGIIEENRAIDVPKLKGLVAKALEDDINIIKGRDIEKEILTAAEDTDVETGEVKRTDGLTPEDEIPSVAVPEDPVQKTPQAGDAQAGPADTVMGEGDDLDRAAGIPDRHVRSNTAIQQIKEVARDGDEAATKKGIEDYIAEFKGAIPEYEGKSDAEKGFDIVKMGMAIAAGESPQAITNISKGVLATIDNFTADDKEKRAYKRQVAMSAAKYALQRVNKDRDRMIAFEDKEKDIVQVMNPKTGDIKTVTKADLRSGNFPKGYLATKNPYGDFVNGVKATKALVVAQAAAAKDNQITSKWLTVGKEYDQNAQKVLDSVQSKNLLGPAIEILNNPDIPITGAKGVMTQSWNRVRNAFGFKDDDVVSKKGEKKEEYISRVQRVIAKKITAILGESNRTISTPDRDRADQLAGVFANYLYDPMVQDPDILRSKIKTLYQTLDNDQKLGTAAMRRIEDSVGSLRTPGGEKAYKDVLRRSADTILGTARGIGPKGKVRKLSEFGAFDAQGVFR